MKTRTLYLGGALVIAGLGALALWSVFADGDAESLSARGARAPAGASLERIHAKQTAATNAKQEQDQASSPEAALDPNEVDESATPVEADSPPAATPEPSGSTLLSGTVVAADGLPIAGAEVRINVASRRRRAKPVDLVTDGMGRFQGEVRAGEIWLRVTAPDHVRDQRGAKVQPGAHDLGEIRLARGARLSGRVNDPEGRPVANARVRARSGGRGRGQNETTDANGLFNLNLREGVYRLSAEAQGFVRTEVDGVPVTQEKGGEALVVLQRGGHLRGTVWSPDGKPQPNAQVFAYRDGERLGAGSADEEGRFSVDGLAPGPLELFARSEDRSLSCRVPIQVSALEQVQDVVLHESAKIVGQVRTPDGRPLPGLRVRAVEVRGDVRRRAESDEQGRFAIENLYPGVYRLEVVRRGNRAPPTPAEEDVEITRGSVERNLIVPVGARVAGKVRDDRGQPLEGAGVFAILDGDYLGSTQTNEQGDFEIEDLPPGSYRLFVRGDGDRLVSLTSIEIAANATLEGLSLVARPPARLRGRVVGPSGEGLAGITLRLRGTDSPVERRARTNPDGSFELGPLYDGDYTGKLSGDALKLLAHKLGRDVEAPEVTLTIVNGRDVEQVWVVR